MKALTIIVLLALVVGKCSSYLIKVPTKPAQPKIATVGWVHIQKLMLPLFENVCEESTNKMVIRLTQEFSFDSIAGAYTKPDVVDNLRNIKSSIGLLPKGEIFTEYDSSHMNELKAIYEFFYYAKDFDTFYKAACWARQNVNCGVFVDAIYLAVLNRRDTSKITVPAPYELLPNYFISKDIIFKASSLLFGEDLTAVEDVRVENNEYILDANYTTLINDDSEDSKLAYFREDIGLNSYYFLRKLRNAPWFNMPINVSSSYGEYMFMMMKHFAARYDLERYSNGLPELESLNWDSVINTYDPMLIYSNGNEFGHRSFSGLIGDSAELNFLKTIENNLATVVSHLRQAGYSKTQILNHLIEILVTSDKNYESLARRLLGYDVEVIERQYSTLEHYMTSMRDPIFWKINKKIVELIDKALKMLPSYSRTELYFPGVQVLNIETKKMMTSFESFQFDVTDSLRTMDRNATFQVKIGQMRLDHKPFTIKLNISSLVTQKGLIKIYLGPKTKPGEFALRKNSFVLMDKFEFDLKRGINLVPRSSEKMIFSDDFISLRAIRKKVDDAEFGLDALPLEDVESQVGYPSRLVLPKGLPEGLACQLFVFVAPFTKNNVDGSVMVGNTANNVAILSPGYPLDLNIEENQLFNLPNVFVKDITITHKGETKTSGFGEKTGPKNWNSDNSYSSKRFDYPPKNENIYDKQDYGNEEHFDLFDETHNLLGEKPNFTFRNKENTDYSANRNQYKYKKSDTSKQNDYRKENFEVKEENTALKQTDSSINTNTDNPETKSEPVFSYEMDSSLFGKPHKLLGERPAFTYRNKGNLDSRSNKNQFRYKENYLNNRPGKYDESYTITETTNIYENMHGAYDSQTKHYFRNGNLDGNTKDKQIVTDTKQSYRASKSPKYSYDKSQQNKQTIEPTLQTINDMIDISYEKIHGLLGARPDFTYKDTKDYSSKRSQYKDKKDQYIKKRTDFLPNTTEKQTDFKNKNYTKFIVVDDQNSMVFKNVTENKNVYLDKNNIKRYDAITKEIIENPITKKADTVMVKEIIGYPITVDDGSIESDEYVDDSIDSTIYDPVYNEEIPRKRYTVYDFLFNNNFDDEKVYE